MFSNLKYISLHLLAKLILIPCKIKKCLKSSLKNDIYNFKKTSTYLMIFLEEFKTNY